MENQSRAEQLGELERETRREKSIEFIIRTLSSYSGTGPFPQSSFGERIKRRQWQQLQRSVTAIYGGRSLLHEIALAVCHTPKRFLSGGSVASRIHTHTHNVRHFGRVGGKWNTEEYPKSLVHLSHFQPARLIEVNDQVPSNVNQTYLLCHGHKKFPQKKNV